MVGSPTAWLKVASLSLHVSVCHTPLLQVRLFDVFLESALVLSRLSGKNIFQ